MSKSVPSAQLQPALKQILERILQVSGSTKENMPWLLGGSCGLLLQGITLEQPPRDIDLYADSLYIDECHRRLTSKFSVIDGPEWNETRMYRSRLSHYQAETYMIELVGDFEVRARESYYRVHAEDLYKDAVSLEHNVESTDLRLMPLAHELVFNLLRDRPDRYEPIAAHIAANSQAHASLIEQIIARNGFHPQMIQRIRRLSGTDGQF